MYRKYREPVFWPIKTSPKESVLQVSFFDGSTAVGSIKLNLIPEYDLLR
jgi:hypothetical protein